jgi:hypothetical protein
MRHTFRIRTRAFGLGKFHSAVIPVPDRLVGHEGTVAFMTFEAHEDTALSQLEAA